MDPYLNPLNLWPRVAHRLKSYLGELPGKLWSSTNCQSTSSNPIQPKHPVVLQYNIQNLPIEPLPKLREFYYSICVRVSHLLMDLVAGLTLVSIQSTTASTPTVNVCKTTQKPASTMHRSDQIASYGWATFITTKSCLSVLINTASRNVGGTTS